MACFEKNNRAVTQTFLRLFELMRLYRFPVLLYTNNSNDQSHWYATNDCIKKMLYTITVRYTNPHLIQLQINGKLFFLYIFLFPKLRQLLTIDVTFTFSFFGRCRNEIYQQWIRWRPYVKVIQLYMLVSKIIQITHWEIHTKNPSPSVQTLQQ